MRNNFKELSDELKPREKMRRASSVRTVDDASLLAVMLKTGTQGCDVVIVAHNHPSGDSTPSRDDVVVTKRLVEASAVIGIALLDHIVIGSGSHISLRESGMM